MKIFCNATPCSGSFTNIDLALWCIPVRRAPCFPLPCPYSQVLLPSERSSDSEADAHSPSPSDAAGQQQQPGASGRPGVVSSIEAAPYPSSLQALLAVVVTCKVGGRSALGAPITAAGGDDGSGGAALLGIAIRRLASRRRPGAGRHGGDGGGGSHGGRGRPGHAKRRRGRLGAGQRSGSWEAERLVAAPAFIVRRFLSEVAALDSGAVGGVVDADLATLGNTGGDGGQGSGAGIQPGPGLSGSLGVGAAGVGAESQGREGGEGMALSRSGSKGISVHGSGDGGSGSGVIPSAHESGAVWEHTGSLRPLPGLGLRVKPLTAKAMRQALGMTEHQTGGSFMVLYGPFTYKN